MTWNEPDSKDAFVLSWVSVVLTAIAAFAGIVFYMESGSVLCLVFGLENCVDFLSSVVVLWRFYCPGEMTKDREDLLHKREKRASMAISFILVLLGLGVIITSADDLSKGAESKEDLKIVVAISFISIFIFGTLTIVKFQFANKLSSASLYKDGICSLIGTVLSVSLFVNTLIIEAVPTIWWLDPVVAIACGFVALGLGMHAIVVATCVQGLPIFSMQWWFVSQGDGMDEMGSRDLQPTDFGQEDGDLELKETEEKPKLSEVV